MGDYTTPTLEEMIEIERQARKMQAEALRNGVKGLWARASHLSLSGLFGNRRAHG